MHMDDASEASPALCSQLNKTVPSHHFSSTVPVEWASADQPMPVTHTAEKLFESQAYFSTSLGGKVRGIFNRLVKTKYIFLRGKKIFIYMESALFCREVTLLSPLRSGWWCLFLAVLLPSTSQKIWNYFPRTQVLPGGGGGVCHRE